MYRADDIRLLRCRNPDSPRVSWTPAVHSRQETDDEMTQGDGDHNNSDTKPNRRGTHSLSPSPRLVGNRRNHLRSSSGSATRRWKTGTGQTHKVTGGQRLKGATAPGFGQCPHYIHFENGILDGGRNDSAGDNNGDFVGGLGSQGRGRAGEEVRGRSSLPSTLMRRRRESGESSFIAPSIGTVVAGYEEVDSSATIACGS